VTRRAELDAVAGCLAGQLGRVALDRARVGRRARRREQVEPERPLRQRAQLGDLGANRVCRPIARRQEAEPARLADGSRQGGRGGSARQRRLDDRVFEPV
jgi:hypothetical protein